MSSQKFSLFFLSLRIDFDDFFQAELSIHFPTKLIKVDARDFKKLSIKLRCNFENLVRVTRFYHLQKGMHPTLNFFAGQLKREHYFVATIIFSYPFLENLRIKKTNLEQKSRKNSQANNPNCYEREW